MSRRVTSPLAGIAIGLVSIIVPAVYVDWSTPGTVRSSSDYRTAPTISIAAVLPDLPRLDTHAEASRPAVRVQPPSPALREDVVPTTVAPTGILGLPLAPVDLDRCQTMNFYRIQFGLPDRFSDQPRQPVVSFGAQGLGWRESNCRNDVTSSTGCCVGYWQLHSIVFRDHRTIPGMERCTATWLNVRGTDPLSQQRQACAAKVLFDAVGYQPWAL